MYPKVTLNDQDHVNKFGLQELEFLRFLGVQHPKHDQCQIDTARVKATRMNSESLTFGVWLVRLI